MLLISTDDNLTLKHLLNVYLTVQPLTRLVNLLPVAAFRFCQMTLFLFGSDRGVRLAPTWRESFNGKTLAAEQTKGTLKGSPLNLSQTSLQSLKAECSYHSPSRFYISLSQRGAITVRRRKARGNEPGPL